MEGPIKGTEDMIACQRRLLTSFAGVFDYRHKVGNVQLANVCQSCEKQIEKIRKVVVKQTEKVTRFFLKLLVASVVYF